MVMPAGFRVRNSTESSADYLATIPAVLRLVRVTIGDGTLITFSAEEIAARGGVTIDVAR